MSRMPLLLAAALVLTGCGSASDGARDTALGFYDQLGREPARACELLAPGTIEELESTDGPCEQSLPESDLPAAARARHVDVFGKRAMVELDADVMFLAHFDDGWRVVAAGCTPRPERPYDCSVKGP